MPLADVVFFAIGRDEPIFCNFLMAVRMPSKSTPTSDVLSLRSGREGDFKVLSSAFTHEYPPRLIISGVGLPITRYQSHYVFAH